MGHGWIEAAVEQRDRRWAGALAAAAAVVAVAYPTGARAAEVPPVSVVDVDAADAPQVTLTAAVRLPPELEGTILPDDAFTVIENGTPRPLQVDRVPERRLEVVILLDTSTALSREVVDAARSAAVEFILRLPPTARIVVRGTGGHVRTGVAFGTGAATAIAAVGGLAREDSTALYDAVALAVRLEFPRRGGRRVIVAMSASADTASERSVDAVADDLVTADAVLYGVELRTPPGGAALERLTAAGGGELLTATDAGDLVGLYDHIARDLRNLYDLVYASRSAGTAAVRVIVGDPALQAEATTRVRRPVSRARGLGTLPPVNVDEPAPESRRQVARESRRRAAPPPLAPPGRVWPLVTAGIAGVAALAAGAWLVAARRRRRQSKMPWRRPRLPVSPSSSVRRRRRPRLPASLWVRARLRRRRRRRLPASPWAVVWLRRRGWRRAGGRGLLDAHRSPEIHVRTTDRPAGGPAEPPTAPLPPPPAPAVIRLPDVPADTAATGAVALDDLRAALTGEPLLRVRTTVPRLVAAAQTLDGQRMAVEARGAHLLVWFQPDGQALHTRLGPRGSWSLYRSRPSREEQSRWWADICLETQSWTAVCFGAQVCELLSGSEVEAHPDLGTVQGRR